MGSYYAGIMNATDVDKLEHYGVGPKRGEYKNEPSLRRLKKIRSQEWFGLPRAEFI